MRREWVFWNQDTIDGEFDDLPARDASKLAGLMHLYRDAGFGNPYPAQVDDYGDGIYRLRHVKSAYSGRLLFFAVFRGHGVERLVVLTVYKKESQVTPKRVLERAKSRMAEYQKRGEER